MAKKLTRWQVRLNKELETLVREKSERDHRSINKTITVILEDYFYKEDRVHSKNTNS